MNIVLSDAKTVRITWPRYDAATEAEIVRRLQTVPGITGMGRRWYAPVIQLHRLMDLFPKASFDYAAMQAADATARTFVDSMVYMGVGLVIDDSGAIVAVGEAISPIIQQLVDERAHALRPLVEAGMGEPRAKPEPVVERERGPLTEEERKLNLWLTGARNAAKRERKQKAMRARVYRRKAIEQAELL